MANSNRNTFVVDSPNFVPIVGGIVVDVGHGVDAVEVESAWVVTGDELPFLPGTTADVTDGGAGVGPEDVGNHARVSDVDVSILRRGEKLTLGRRRLNERRENEPGECSSRCRLHCSQRTGNQPPMP